MRSQGCTRLVVFQLLPVEKEGAQTQACVIWNSWPATGFTHGGLRALSLVVALPKTVWKPLSQVRATLEMGKLRPREIIECLRPHSWEEVSPTVGHGSAAPTPVLLAVKNSAYPQGKFAVRAEVWVLRMPFLDVATWL